MPTESQDGGPLPDTEPTPEPVASMTRKTTPGEGTSTMYERVLRMLRESNRTAGTTALAVPSDFGQLTIRPSIAPTPSPLSVGRVFESDLTASTGAASVITDIDWDMMDKRKFVSYNVVSSFSIRALIYPLSVIKTRLQVQRQQSIYRGTFDAFVKISRFEGVYGLYKGFWINSTQAVSGIFYMLTYEGVRHLFTDVLGVERKVSSLVGGATASLVGITIINPIDVVSQHMMLHGQKVGAGKAVEHSKTNRLDFSQELKAARFGLAEAISRAIYSQYGFIGFYKGYFAALMLYVPNSAIWWYAYQNYTELLGKLTPDWVPLSVLQCTAAPASGATAACLTNSLDVIRVRLQVEPRYSLRQTVVRLWKEERWNMATKGLTARMPLSMVFSLLIATGYETVKRLSVKEEYKHHVRW